MNSNNSKIRRRSEQMYRYLSRTLGVQAVSHLLEDTRIAAAIHNKFGTRIEAYDDDSRVTARIVEMLQNENHLQKFVDTKKLTRQKTVFTSMDGHSISEFPTMILDDLRRLLGKHPVKEDVLLQESKGESGGDAIRAQLFQRIF